METLVFIATAGRSWEAIRLLTPEERFLRSCKGQPVDRPPVWLMRQAGRYLPEYREVRSGVTFLEMCADVERAVEVSLQPIDLVGSEVVILFSDIFIPILGMDVDLEFSPGPIISEPIREWSQLNELRVKDPEKTVPYVFEIIRRLRGALESRHIPLVGFAGSPFTLACYLLNGKGDPTGEFSLVKELADRDPDFLIDLIKKLGEETILYLRAQVDAGAHAVQIFDTWARILTESQYRRFVLPVIKKIAKSISGRVPFVLFGGEACHLVQPMLESGCDVFSAGSSMSLRDLVKLTGGKVALQGNLPPDELNLPPEKLFNRVREMANEAEGARGYIVNLGHGCRPDTPVAGVRSFTDAVRALAGT